jgi:hypothetical protein
MRLPRQTGDRMKLNIYALTLVITAPVFAWSQGAPGPARADMKVAFSNMQSNVTNISGPLEKERWEANIALWQVRLGHMGKLEKADIDNMRPSFNVMNANVAKITEPAERERWRANRDLWQIALTEADKLSSADRDKMKVAFDKMQANLVKITGVWEKGRWQANRDLWQAMIGQM